MRGLQDKLAIVTGAASPIGIGFATAKRLAEEGAWVALTDIDNVRAGEGAIELQREGYRAIGLAHDAVDEASWERVLQTTRGQRPSTIEERVRLIEDHEDIERLMSLYCHYNDGGWEGQGPSHMGPSADLFVENGVWDDCGTIGKAEGREKIRALFMTLRATPYVSHNVMNPLIDVNGDVARGHWHLIALSKWPNGRAIEDNDGHWSLATYSVEFQRTSDGWRFAKMIIERGREMPQRGYNAPPQWSVK